MDKIYSSESNDKISRQKSVNSFWDNIVMLHIFQFLCFFFFENL